MLSTCGASNAHGATKKIAADRYRRRLCARRASATASCAAQSSDITACHSRLPAMHRFRSRPELEMPYPEALTILAAAEREVCMDGSRRLFCNGNDYAPAISDHATRRT